jgi:ACS family allantoate permease-like MFS transporter
MVPVSRDICGSTHLCSFSLRCPFRYHQRRTHDVFSQLIVSFGYKPTQSLLYGIPGGFDVIVACLFNGWTGGYFQNRALIASIPMASAMIGIFLIVALPINGQGYYIARLIGYYMTQTKPVSGATILCLISSNVAGSTKRTTVAAFYLIGYCAGIL